MWWTSWSPSMNGRWRGWRNGASPRFEFLALDVAFRQFPAFLVAHHAVVDQDSAEALLADAARVGARFQPADGVVELPGGLAARRRGRRVAISPARPRWHLPLSGRHVFKRRFRCRIRPGISE